jgi:hypothetical protein
MPFRQKSGSVREAIAVLYLRRSAGSKPCAKPGCGVKKSASVRVCQTSKVSERFIKKTLSLFIRFLGCARPCVFVVEYLPTLLSRKTKLKD